MVDKWAAGFSRKRPKRVAAAYLAMAVALAADAEQLTALYDEHPEFIALCKSAGLGKDI